MDIKLIHGRFTPQESLDLISRLIQVKIDFHLEKIHQSSMEEDVKMRESKIKALQLQMNSVREHLHNREQRVDIDSHIQIG